MSVLIALILLGVVSYYWMKSHTQPKYIRARRDLADRGPGQIRGVRIRIH